MEAMAVSSWLITADVIDGLAQLDASSVQAIVTCPEIERHA